VFDLCQTLLTNSTSVRGQNLALLHAESDLAGAGEIGEWVAGEGEEAGFVVGGQVTDFTFGED